MPGTAEIQELYLGVHQRVLELAWRQSLQVFDRSKILTNAQHGFRKKRSCDSQLIVTIHDIASKMERDSPVLSGVWYNSVRIGRVDLLLLSK
jgi:ABC-type molybdate transport system ATPase subunit